MSNALTTARRGVRPTCETPLAAGDDPVPAR